MYEMLTGHVPFDGDTAVAVALKHLQEDLKGPKELIPEIPNSTNAIVYLFGFDVDRQLDRQPADYHYRIDLYAVR